MKKRLPGGMATALSLAVLLFFFILFVPAPLPAGEKMKVGQTYHGFKFLEERYIAEKKSLSKRFEHVQSGAKLLKLENNDDNNVFTISFATLPDSDSGMAHILEHSVLNGSEKFPVKSPMAEMYKSSLKTFLNALTQDEATAYPFSSRNKKDFFNLLNVILDATLFPRLHKEPKIYLQEAWHYELEKPEDPLVYRGIVYNEMKGAYSSPGREFAYQAQKHLFPDTPYTFESGGYPDAIPELTYEKLTGFHKTYYHPGNARIFLYGNIDTLEELAFIDREFLSRFDHGDDYRIPLQKPFAGLREVTAEYATPMNEQTAKKTWLGLSFVIGEASQMDLTLALDLLADALVNRPDAPIRRALVDAGIGQDVSASVSNMKQNVFTIRVNNAEETDREKFRNIVFQCLEKVVKTGLDKRRTEGLFNRAEFQLREDTGGGGASKALGDGINALRFWLYTDDPYIFLEYEKPLAALKKAIQSDYLEQVIRREMLGNPHALLLVMKPKPGLAEEKKAKTDNKLAEYKATLTPEQIRQMIRQTKELKEYQERQDTPQALATLPRLSLSDVGKTAEFHFPVKHQAAGVPVLHYPAFTNQIVYMNLSFNATTVPTELIPYVELLNRMLGQLNAGTLTYGELNTLLDIHTGGISGTLKIFHPKGKLADYQPRLVLRGKASREQFGKLAELWGTMIRETQFNDKPRLKELLNQIHAKTQSFVNQAGQVLATSRLGAYLCDSGQYSEQTSGLSFARFVAGLNADFNTKADEIIANLQKTARLLFNKNGLEIFVTCGEEDFPNVKEQLGKLMDRLGNETPAPVKYAFAPLQTNEGLKAASRVQYVIRGANFKDMGYEYSGKMRVLAHLLRMGYLFPKIRVIGGAYGAGSVFDETGFCYLFSYRDPNLKETLTVYNNAQNFLKEFKAETEEMALYIIGAISALDGYLSPYGKGEAAMKNYMEGVDAGAKQKERDEVLGTTAEDIRQMAKLLGDIAAKGYICIYGNEKKLEENKEIFGSLISISE